MIGRLFSILKIRFDDLPGEATMNLNQISRFTLFGLLIAMPAMAQSPEEKGLEIAIKTDQADNGFVGEKADMELKLINAHGDVITRKMSMKTKEGTSSGDRTIISFSWPADVKGTKLLTWSHKDRDDDQWLYLPAIKRVKRISSTNKSASFMGSEFSYEDFSGREVEKYTYKWIEDTEVDGRPVWVTERYPRESNSGYSRTKSWTDQEYLNVVKVEYYDRRGGLLKTAEFKGYKKIDKFWRMGEIDMYNHQTRKRSVMTWTSRDLGVEFYDDEFETDALQD